MAARRSRLWIVATGAGGLLVLAANAGAGQDMTPAFARGAEIAQKQCAACHAVALEAASPVKIAPQFRVLSRLYSAEDLETKLSDIADHGHFDMPAIQLREDEIADVAAYIAGLDGGSVDVPRRQDRPMASAGRPRPAAAASSGI